MEHLATFTQRVEVIKDILIKYLRKEGDRITYDEILAETGLDIRAGARNNAYAESYKARMECSELQDIDPFFVEAVKGKGLQRIRIGQAHIKGNKELSGIRRRSEKVISWCTKAIDWSLSDEESLANRTQTIIHSDILSKSHSDAYRAAYAHLSSGMEPSRPLISLGELLKKDAMRRPWQTE